MNTNRINQIGPPRFRVATHILIRLAKDRGFLSSAAIACEVHSHATFLRRVLASLAQAGIVETREGRDGGYGLKLPAEQITLGDIYIAVKGDCQQQPMEACAGIVQLDQALETIMEAADQQTIEYLRKYTILDLVHMAAQSD
ncbi:RrF2 family transcriptional regulator [Paenibacillus rigui]|uniref:Rrf2 family transcriptional regulator n=1 Tax=Paenibacillus rigui TaxID=554312 RepID=A0A229ULM6_9BACL|nr:Rrf2 family transcriptional regulator [Paenibacillus rigui]OXM84320.1 Rrf2 family transcriptional regulator [Paenibacillus rigui]